MTRETRFSIVTVDLTKSLSRHLTEFLLGFVETLLPARALVWFREHDGYILDAGSASDIEAIR